MSVMSCEWVQVSLIPKPPGNEAKVQCEELRHQITCYRIVPSMEQLVHTSSEQVPGSLCYSELEVIYTW